jgi:5-formyltetrahydrofolate cyclo-ligase
MSAGVNSLRERKIALRAEIQQRFKSLETDKLLALSGKICQSIADTREYQTAACCLFYAAMPDEVNLDSLIEQALLSGKRVLFPRVIPEDGKVEVMEIKDLSRDLLRGHFGIREPRPGIPTIDPGQIELVLMPGRAFDRGCCRCGRGWGFFDRFLEAAGKRFLKIAPALDMQIVPLVPVEQHDRPVDMIVTESEIITIPVCGESGV